MKMNVESINRGCLFFITSRAVNAMLYLYIELDEE